MSFLPFQAQFYQEKVSKLLAQGLSFEESGRLQDALATYVQAAQGPQSSWRARAALLTAFLLLQHKHVDQAWL